MDLEQTDVADATAADEHETAAHLDDDHEIADELLIEEISIDGMCGVY